MIALTNMANFSGVIGLGRQEEVYERCRGVWPERFKHGYAHYSGAFMEEFFFRHWTASRPALPQVSLAAESERMLRASQTRRPALHPAGLRILRAPQCTESRQAVGSASRANNGIGNNQRYIFGCPLAPHCTAKQLIR